MAGIERERISIHSPHARGDAARLTAARLTFAFQSTPLMRGETRREVDTYEIPKFQSTPLMRGETRALERKAQSQAKT